MNITLGIADDIHSALIASAQKAGLEPNIHAVRIIEDYLLAQDGLVSDAAKRDVLLGRSLIERAVEQAMALVAAKGFSSSITFDAIQAVSADRDWLSDYEKLVRDNPYKSGNPRKQTINQNLGHFIKKAVGARSQTKPDGKALNLKVQGAIIQSYTPLEM
ncbi:MAG: hypothetical protein V4475_11850 [Pseudomonadota bacterium]